jgi:hypothetical protein
MSYCTAPLWLLSLVVLAVLVVTATALEQSPLEGPMGICAPHYCLYPEGCDSNECQYFVKDASIGTKKSPPYVLVGRLVLPKDLSNITRSQTIPFSVLERRVDGQDVLCIQRDGLDSLRERDAELLVEDNV